MAQGGRGCSSASPWGLHTGSEQCTAHSNKPTAKQKPTKKPSESAANDTMMTEVNPREDDVPAARSSALPEEGRALKFVAVIGVLLFVGVTPIYGWAFSRGILLGAVLAVSNLWLTTYSVRAFLGSNTGPEETRTRASWGVFVVFKLLVLSSGTYLLFHYGLVHGFALIIGLAALPLGVVCLQLAGPPATARPRK